MSDPVLFWLAVLGAFCVGFWAAIASALLLIERVLDGTFKPLVDEMVQAVRKEWEGGGGDGQR